jgi:hypothetical protein
MPDDLRDDLRDDTPRRPERMAGYRSALATYAAVTLAAIATARRTGRVPQRYAWADVALGAVATHKLARILARDGVTTPLRAPFTTFEGAAGSAEVDERPRDGHLHTVGELVTCPFCLAPWIAATYVAGLALAPGAARAWAATFSVVAGADFLQHAYARVRTD